MKHIRLLLLLFVLLMAQNIKAFTVANDEGVEIEYYVYDADKLYAAVGCTSWDRESPSSHNEKLTGHVNIPEKVTYDGKTYTVTRIANYAFLDGKLWSVTIPKTVETIGSQSFIRCYSLGKINFSEGLREIGSNSFDVLLSLSEVTLPESLEKIGGGNFKGLDGQDRGLKSIHIPKNVKSIGGYCFQSLDTITIDPANPYFHNNNGFITDVNDTLLVCAPAFLKATTMPSTIRRVQAGALFRIDCEYFTIPESVRFIDTEGVAAFNYLRTLYVGSNVDTLGTCALWRHGNMTRMYVARKTPPKTKSDAFDACIQYRDLYVPKGCREAYLKDPKWAGSFSEIFEFDPEKIKSAEDIDNPKWYYIDEIYYQRQPDGNAQAKRSLRYGYHADYATTQFVDIKPTVNIDGAERKVTSIEKNAFKKATTAFADNDNIKKGLRLPKYLTEIGDSAFYNAATRKLIRAFFKDPSKVKLGKNLFPAAAYVRDTLYVPAGSEDAFKKADVWKNFQNIKTLESARVVAREYTINQNDSFGFYKRIVFDFYPGLYDQKYIGGFKASTNYKQGDPPGEYTLEVGYEEGCEDLYNSVEFVPGKIIVKKHNPIEIDIKEAYRRAYGESNPEFEYEVVSGDPDGEVVLKCKADVTSKPGYYSIYADTTKLHNTSIYVRNNSLLEVYKAYIVVTLPEEKKTCEYGDPIPEFEIGGSGFKNGETWEDLEVKPYTETDAVQGSPVGTYPVYIKTGTCTNYAFIYGQGELTITPAELTVSVGDYTRVQGQANPVFELQYSGFKLNDNASVLTELPTATTEATEDSPMGTYAIVVSGGSAQNYTLKYENGTLTVGDPSAIEEIISPESPSDIYSVSGKLLRKNATSTDGLPRGIYVVRGQKIIVTGK